MFKYIIITLICIFCIIEFIIYKYVCKKVKCLKEEDYSEYYMDNIMFNDSFITVMTFINTLLIISPIFIYINFIKYSGSFNKTIFIIIPILIDIIICICVNKMDIYLSNLKYEIQYTLIPFIGSMIVTFALMAFAQIMLLGDIIA